MKKILFALIAVLALFTSCIGGESKKRGATAAKEDIVEVLYFHGKQRCITCNAIEKLTSEVVSSDFADAIKAGKLKMKVIDISTDEGEAIADEYEVTWSSLYVNKWKDGKESRNNLTDLGFSKAKNSPEEFKTQIKFKIAGLLK
ncbi:MAG: nitrophenyl compound nitroreductase subunit ArsF family protein [Rikenellaceae bacterium]